MPFALFFASTALAQILLSIVNAKIVGRRFQPRTLIRFGLILAALAVTALTVGVFVFDTPLILTCAGFLVLMAVQAFIFGNASALAAARLRTSPVPPPPSSHRPSGGHGHLHTDRQLRRRHHRRPYDLGHDRRDRRLPFQLPRAGPLQIQPGRRPHAVNSSL